MSITYGGAHSIIFIDSSQQLSPNGSLTTYSAFYHTWLDFHLVPSSRPFAETPEAAILMANDTVSNRVFDITDDIAGGQIFGLRQGEWEFIVDHDQWANWYTAKKTIEEKINGKRLYCCLMDDYSTLYCGRFVVTGWNDGASYSTVTIQYYLDYETYSLELDLNEPTSLTVSLDPNAPVFYTGDKINRIKPYVNSVVTYGSNKQKTVFIDDLTGVFQNSGTQSITVSYTEKGWGTNAYHTVSSNVEIAVVQDSITRIEAVLKDSSSKIFVGDTKDSIRDKIILKTIYASGRILNVDGSEANELNGTIEEIGNNTISITYGGLSCDFTVYAIYVPHKYEAEWEDVRNSILRGDYATKYPVGSKVPIRIGNVYDDYAEVVGVNLDKDQNNNIIPLTFVLSKSLYISDGIELSRIGYINSNLRNVVTSYYDKFPYAIRKMIKSAKKVTYQCQEASDTNTNFTTLENVWIPSYREVSGNDGCEPSDVVYSRFSQSPGLRRKIRYGDVDDTYKQWSLRTNYVSSETGVYYWYYVDNAGYLKAASLNKTYSFALGFCVGNPSN